MLTVARESTRCDAECAQLRAGLRRHTAAFAPCGEYEEITIVLRDAAGQFCGAAFGEAGRGWLHLSAMWVQEEFRGQGWGKQLLAAAEQAAIERGCRQAYLDTFSYQARPFYERCGYRVFGVLEDYPPGHSRFFMTKRLVAECAAPT